MTATSSRLICPHGVDLTPDEVRESRDRIEITRSRYCDQCSRNNPWRLADTIIRFAQRQLQRATA